MDSNSKNMRTDGEMPEMDFFIHASQEGLRVGFEPKNGATGEEVLICLSVGIRCVCGLLATKMDMPEERIQTALLTYVNAVFNEDFEDQLGYDGYDMN